MIKKICAMVLTYLLILGNCIINVQASNTNDFNYLIDSTGTEVYLIGYNGTDSNIVIPEEINGRKVTKIYDFSCSNIDEINTLSIPASINNIGMLTELPIHNISVTGDYYVVENGILFSSDKTSMVKCISSINEVDIPESVNNIVGNCFSGTKISSLTIPESVSFFDSLIYSQYLRELTVKSPINMFYLANTPALEVVYLPATVNYFGVDYDAKLSSLTAVNFDESNPYYQSINGVVYQNNSLFYYPSNKQDTKYVIPDGIVGIEMIQSYNQYVTEIEFSSQLDNIFAESFHYFPSLNTITTANNLNYSVENGILYHNDRLVYCVSKDQKVVSVKDGTMTIGAYAFAQHGEIEEIQLPESISTVESSAFRDCTNLKTINIPKEVSSLHEVIYNEYENNYSLSYNYVFEGCNSLENVTVDSENQSYVIENGALYTADYSILVKFLDNNTDSFTVNDNTKCIATEAFRNKENITMVDLRNVTDVIYFSFADCTKLENLAFDNVNNFGAGYIFNNCPSLKEITLPEKYIYLSCTCPLFANCDNLETINLNNLESYNDTSLLENCDKINKIILPRTINEIYIFSNNNFKYYVYKDSYAHQKIEEINQQIEEGTYDSFTDLVQYEIINEMADTETDIVIDSQLSDVIDENTVLSVDHIEEGNDYNYVASSLENFVMYDITLTKDGQNVELDEGVEVKIPVAQGMNTESCRVYHLSDDNVYTDMNAVYKDGYMVFKTDHFSKYIVTDGEIKTKLGDVNEDGIINFSDAILILQADSQLVELTEKQKQAADVNKDKQINFNDAIKILQYDAGIIKEF